MKLKKIINYEMNSTKKSSLQVKAIKGLAGFLVFMFFLTVLSRAADSLTIAKISVVNATGMMIEHKVEADGQVAPNKAVAISTVANVKIDNVNATEGKSVKKGDLLMQLDKDDLNKKLLQAKKELQILEATASDKAANEAIEERNKQKEMNRTYEDYRTTVSDANDSVTKAEAEMDEAYAAYKNAKKESGSSSASDDTSVTEVLTQTIAEKQQIVTVKTGNLDGIEKDIEADVQKAIEEASVDTDGSPVELTQDEKQKIRNQIQALPENVAMLDQAKKELDEAEQELQEAKTALDTYQQEQASSSSEQAAAHVDELYNVYKEKKEAYNEAVKQKNTTIKSADRILEDAQTQGAVDTVSALSENNEMELKQLEVKKLDEVLRADGKIEAPSDGLVVKVNVSTGETTTEDTAFRISDQSAGYKFTASLDKTEAKYLSKGDSIILDIGNNKQVEGLKIEDIEISSEDKNTYIVTVSIPAKVKEVGSMATMRVEKASKKYNTCLPLSALHSDGNQYYVYAVTQKETILGLENAVEKVEVTILDKNNEYVAVDGYFDYDQQFVTDSSKTLRSGDRVRLKEE